MRSSAAFTGGSLISVVLPVLMSPLLTVSSAICSHQPLPSLSAARPYVTPLGPVVGHLKVGDLSSVNFSVTGSKCSAPSGEVTQTLPCGSVSSVTAPPVGDMPCGGT